MMGWKQPKVLTKAKTVNMIAAKVASGIHELLRFVVHSAVKLVALRMVEVRRGESQEETNWPWEQMGGAGDSMAGPCVGTRPLDVKVR